MIQVNTTIHSPGPDDLYFFWIKVKKDTNHPGEFELQLEAMVLYRTSGER